MTHRTCGLLPAAVLTALALAPASSAAQEKSVTLVLDGSARAAIYAPAGVMAGDRKLAPTATFAEREAEANRQLLRESVKDLAHYLGKMSGAKVEVVQAAPAARDKRVAVLIGRLAEKAFGPVAKKAPHRQGFRVVAGGKGVGLYGESDEGSSYAVYELLHRLGCRWFMPSELGEDVPRRKTVAVPVMDFSGAPGTLYRGIWYADADFKRRTRNNGSAASGAYIAAGHALEHYVTKEQRAKHPEWRAVIGGKSHPLRLKWSHPGVQQAVADAIIAQLDKNYVPSISLSPEDGGEFDQTDDTKWDAGDTDPVMNGPAITDRYVKFCNLVAEKVAKKHPHVKLGFLAYVQYTQPPLREKLHPNLVPMFAPINYCRAHAMTDPACPSRRRVKGMVEGWGKASPGGVSYYNYMFNLAEYSAPYPMMHQMREELDIIYKNNVRYWQPEGMSNFEQVLPGLYLTLRKAWDPKEDSAAVLDEFFTRFYGAAEKPMRRYWALFDEQWTKVDEHSGGGWDYARRFTPAFMKKARGAMDEALASARTATEYRRVKMQDEALRQFERWMRMVWDLNEGRLAGLGPQSGRWVSRQVSLAEDYEKQYAFSKTGWADSVAANWFRQFYQPTYLDATRLTRDFTVISEPLRRWKYAADRDRAGERQRLFEPKHADGGWKVTDVAVERWATLGIPDYFGPVWYRQTVKVPAVPTGKKVYLWLSRVDGTAKVWVNGQAIAYAGGKGKATPESPPVYGAPLSFDITAALRPGADNQITVRGTRTFINELGTGGLLGPAFLYREK
jgi:hypothetical protein